MNKPLILKAIEFRDSVGKWTIYDFPQEVMTAFDVIKWLESLPNVNLIWDNRPNEPNQKYWNTYIRYMANAKGK